ncbi:hypothetical protein O77CONTIG1_00436 [Leptolyngbya sp. O-77]|nr:hypothetical protein O77CONTIG1_00436 [Leptolyngbya sp. O-77]
MILSNKRRFRRQECLKVPKSTQTGYPSDPMRNTQIQIILDFREA